MNTNMNLPKGYWYHPEGYLWYVLPVDPFRSLPQYVELNDFTLEKKQEFHVTIMNVRGVAAAISERDGKTQEIVEREILGLLTAFVTDHPIAFSSFSGDLRLAKSRERISIAARCTMQGIEGFFDTVQSNYGCAIPLQATHVSLYTLPGIGAVGIDSDVEMESYDRVSVPQIEDELNTMTL